MGREPPTRRFEAASASGFRGSSLCSLRVSQVVPLPCGRDCGRTAQASACAAGTVALQGSHGPRASRAGVGSSDAGLTSPTRGDPGSRAGPAVGSSVACANGAAPVMTCLLLRLIPSTPSCEVEAQEAAVFIGENV